MDVVVWLRSLGLGKYEAAFRENEIDETVLPSLTHETLKELGVTAVGHRLKLLDAIAALRNEAGGKASSVDAAATSSTLSAHPEDRAERRQVTVMSPTWWAHWQSARSFSTAGSLRCFTWRSGGFNIFRSAGAPPCIILSL